MSVFICLTVTELRKSKKISTWCSNINLQSLHKILMVPSLGWKGVILKDEHLTGHLIRSEAGREIVMSLNRKRPFALERLCGGLRLACVIVDVFCYSHTRRKTLASTVWL